MSKKRKVTARNKAFGAASRACIAEKPGSWRKFGDCMSDRLKKGRKGRRKKKR